MNHLTPLKNHVQNDLFEKITWKMNRLKNHMQNESFDSSEKITCKMNPLKNRIA